MVSYPDCSLHIRGWMTETTTGGLTQIVHYTDGPGTPCYNGNISSLLWKEHTQTDIDQTQGYRFTYDGQNRMKDAIYGESLLLNQNTGRFNEQVTGYDRNGNLTGLLRYGKTEAGTETYGLVDNLNMVYQGNQLKSVYDNATHTALTGSMEFKDGANQTTEYVYDENGNLTRDLNKNIADIQYNLLDLPQKVEFENGNRIYFLYAADGTKTRSTYISGNDTTTVSYLGNAVYENDVLVRFLTAEGYITPAESNSHALSDSGHLVDGIFHYYFHDHQGNVRAVFAQDGTMEECNDYYPFGGWRNATVASASTDNSIQPYKYNSKELVRKFGLDWYDYGARWYDAALGRWNAVDPMAESYYGMTPYNYCGNEPVNRTDPDGMDWYQDDFGNTFWQLGSDPVEGYTNIGSYFSVPMSGGGFVNYYQNVIISFTLEPENAFERIVAYFPLQNHLLSKQSPLTLKDQIKLFRALNSRSIDSWLRPLEEKVVMEVASWAVGAVAGKAISYGISNFSLYKKALTYVQTGGKTFAEYKKMKGGTETLGSISTSTGEQRISTEFHHVFITQRLQKHYKIPNWLVNNNVNV